MKKGDSVASAHTLREESKWMPWPEKLLGEWFIASSLFVFSVVLLWPFREYTELFGDEGIFLQGAQRILAGEVPYRDFFTYFTPGSYYWIALRFKILGTSLFAGRVILLVYGGILSAALYMLARRTCSRWNAALLAYLYLVVGLPYRFVVLHNWDSAVLALLALYAAVLWIQTAHRAWALATGTLVSLCCLFDQPKGAGLVVGLGLGLLIIARRPPDQGIFKCANLIGAVSGLAWPALGTMAYFASKQSLGTMIEDCLWPLAHVGHYSNVNRLPYGYIPMRFESWEMFFGSGSVLERLFFVLFTSPFLIIPALPVLAVILLIVACRRMNRDEQRSPLHSCNILISACGIGLTLGAIATGRPEIDHLIYIGPPLFLVMGSLAGVSSSGNRFVERLRTILFSFFLVAFTANGAKFLVSGPLNAKETLESRRGRLRLPGRDTVISYIEGSVRRGERIFVYPYQPLYYFLTGTFNSTQFDYLHLGLHTPEHMAKAIAELEADRTETIIFAPAFNSWVIPLAFPATPQKVLDSDPVRDFIFARYRPCKILPSLEWPYVVMRRQDLPCLAGGTSNLPGP